MRNVEIFYNFIIDSLKNIFELLLIVILFTLVNKQEIEVAIAVALFSYRTNVFSNFMERLSNFLTELSNFNISAYRIFDILEYHTYSKENFGPNSLARINGNFSFENVTFGYLENTEVLKNLTFSVKSGQTVAIIGKSGAGKSGKIYLDGIDITTLNENSIRSNISIISQNPYIFNMSIKENFKLVKPDVTDKEIEEACTQACIHDFINTLPYKYDTVIGENGVLLSGGQRQRIAIARALIQKNPIILFDEATSSLDNETQNDIQIAIENLKEQSTILIIAHRLSTIMNCDKILLLENGKILDSGTHHDLISRNEKYRNICETELVKKD